MMPRLVPPGRSRRWWRHRLRAVFTEQLPLKATAVALALVLWFTVTVRQQAEHVMNVRFLPTLDPGVALAGPAPPIRALIRGSGRDILTLYSSPPAIRKTISDVVGDTMTIQLRTDEVDLPPGMTATVRDVQPRRIVLRFERTDTRPGAVPASRVAPSAAQPVPQAATPRPAPPEPQSSSKQVEQPETQPGSPPASQLPTSQLPAEPPQGTLQPSPVVPPPPRGRPASGAARNPAGRSRRDTVSGVRGDSTRRAADTTSSPSAPDVP